MQDVHILVDFTGKLSESGFLEKVVLFDQLERYNESISFHLQFTGFGTSFTSRLLLGAKAEDPPS